MTRRINIAIRDDNNGLPAGLTWFTSCDSDGKRSGIPRSNKKDKITRKTFEQRRTVSIFFFYSQRNWPSETLVDILKNDHLMINLVTFFFLFTIDLVLSDWSDISWIVRFQLSVAHFQRTFSSISKKLVLPKEQPRVPNLSRCSFFRCCCCSIVNSNRFHFFQRKTGDGHWVSGSVWKIERADQ